ncbi:MAG: carboxypeptidase-like regulatory domain-containing protein, partial [Dysgonamonadaceae bacterium]
MKNFFLLCVALLMSFQLIAQQRRVSGTVLDSKDKSAMIGANIMEKGTLNGTITDINGNFSLNVTSSNSILVVSSIGYKTLEVVVGNRSILNLEMDEETELLD